MAVAISFGASVMCCAQRSHVPPGDGIEGRAHTLDSIVHLYRGSASGIMDSLRLIIEDGATFESLARRIGSEAFPIVPRIDFQANQVAIAALGVQPSAGVTISIDTVTYAGDRRTIIVRRTFPPSDCPAPQMITQPTDVVVLPRTALVTRFLERQVTRSSCLP
jgi:hypothetical protein